MSLIDSHSADIELEPASTPKDGRRLAGVAIGLAIGGIVVPIILSIAAIITAAIAKKRLPHTYDTKQLRSFASTAQVFAVIDMIGYTTIITLFIRGI